MDKKLKSEIDDLEKRMDTLKNKQSELEKRMDTLKNKLLYKFNKEELSYNSEVLEMVDNSGVVIDGFNI